MRLAALLCLLSALASGQTPGPEPRLRIWSRESLHFEADPLAGDAPMRVGSLQKPFVAKAWAFSHPDQMPPQITCTRESGCWFPRGHGKLGMARALAVSCNAYFRRLAEETPLAVLQKMFAEEGFVGTPADANGAIGLPGETSLLIRPSRLLEAYERLVKEPWSEGEAIRSMVLAGLRTAPRNGTAATLGVNGCWAKTGTVSGVDGHSKQTRGFVWMRDDADRQWLAELEPGTGHEAASALGRRLRSGTTAVAQNASAQVTMKLFDLMPSRTWTVRNLGSGPVPARGGFLGPSAVLHLRSGDWVGPGLLEIEVPHTGLVRRLEGRVDAAQEGGSKQLVATLNVREYVSGVVLAELPVTTEERRVALGATILRFLAKGPRHGAADVCDNTHCAWFVGRGPRLVWATPNRAMRVALDRGDPLPITDAEWVAIQTMARQPGPCQWSADCGGAPLSSHAVWGDGNREITPCPRHTSMASHWERCWKLSDLARAFGVAVGGLEIRRPDGVWTLAVQGDNCFREYRFDEAHRGLAKVLGWDALPSPADDIQRIPEGYRVTGVGQGHRVGLCLRD